MVGDAVGCEVGRIFFEKKLFQLLEYTKCFIPLQCNTNLIIENMKAVNGKIIFDKEDVKLMCRVITDHAKKKIYGPEWQGEVVEHIFDNDILFTCSYTARYYGGYYRPETYNRSYGVWEPEEYDEGELQFSDYCFDYFFDDDDNEYTSEQTNISDFYDFINKELYIE